MSKKFVGPLIVLLLAAAEATPLDTAFAVPHRDMTVRQDHSSALPNRPAKIAGASPIKTVILVCANTISRARCQPSTALDILIAPAATTFGHCGLQAQAYIASSTFAQQLREDKFLKIICTRHEVTPTIAWPMQ